LLRYAVLDEKLFPKRDQLTNETLSALPVTGRSFDPKMADLERVCLKGIASEGAVDGAGRNFL
jgi:hypothetical protein